MSEYNDIVLFSRVRFARNLAHINFPAKLTDYDEATSIVKAFYEVLGDDFEFFKIKNMQNLQSLILLEKNLISKELIENKDISSVALDEKNHISIMLNEEDHIREQCILDGFKLQEAYEKLNIVDDLILENFEIATDKKLGFLTSSLSNLGTGMRCSVMMFLPALTMMGKIDSLSKSAKQLGLTVRGKYGENSVADGFMYQLSNEISLGYSEEQLIQNVINVALKVCEMEKEFLKQIMLEKKDEIMDLCLRSFGTLTNCHLIGTNEAIKLLSNVKLGVNLGIIKLKNKNVINEAMTKVQPANLMEMSSVDLNQKERDKFRADYLKNLLLKEKI